MDTTQNDGDGRKVKPVLISLSLVLGVHLLAANLLGLNGVTRVDSRKTVFTRSFYKLLKFYLHKVELVDRLSKLGNKVRFAHPFEFAKENGRKNKWTPTQTWVLFPKKETSRYQPNDQDSFVVHTVVDADELTNIILNKL